MISSGTSPNSTSPNSTSPNSSTSKCSHHLSCNCHQFKDYHHPPTITNNPNTNRCLHNESAGKTGQAIMPVTRMDSSFFYV